MTAPVEPMSDERLWEIEMRAALAPRGPWHVEYCGDEGYPQQISNPQAFLIAETYQGGTGVRPTPEFIAHARTDVGDLVAEVKRLRTELGDSQ